MPQDGSAPSVYAEGRHPRNDRKCSQNESAAPLNLFGRSSDVDDHLAHDSIAGARSSAPEARREVSPARKRWVS
jgi:hypothetical protein